MTLKIPPFYCEVFDLSCIFDTCTKLRSALWGGAFHHPPRQQCWNFLKLADHEEGKARLEIRRLVFEKYSHELPKHMQSQGEM